MRILRDVLLGLGLGIAALGSAQAAEKPNIVVIMVDDMAPMDVSAYNRGLGAVTTPNIDRIAKEGVMISDYY
ncbi:MAG: sulfatase-like hydrolase/transferase, partial [Delftia acidovorans]|nr:sulfatase-like hydrolase/transferase [Delftia acidovorans]